MSQQILDNDVNSDRPLYRESSTYYNVYYQQLEDNLTTLQGIFNKDIVDQLEPWLSKSILINTLIRITEDVESCTISYDLVNHRWIPHRARKPAELLYERRKQWFGLIDKKLVRLLESVGKIGTGPYDPANESFQSLQSLQSLASQRVKQLLDTHCYPTINPSTGDCSASNMLQLPNQTNIEASIDNLITFLHQSFLYVPEDSDNIIKYSYYLLRRSVTYLLINWLIDYFHYQRVILFHEMFSDYYPIVDRYSSISYINNSIVKICHSQGCLAIIRRGGRVGELCGKNTWKESNYCTAHHKLRIIEQGEYQSNKVILPLDLACCSRFKIMYLKVDCNVMPFIVKHCDNLQKSLIIASYSKGHWNPVNITNLTDSLRQVLKENSMFAYYGTFMSTELLNQWFSAPK